MGGFYTPIVVEIHNLNELEMAKEIGVKHFLLDNFTPEEIAEAVLYLVKDDSGFITGTTLNVNGGQYNVP